MRQPDVVMPPDAVVAPHAGCRAGFPVVGIGCSAGGLEALEKFLTHAPATTGMAFVIVQHLAPEQVSALPELLQRFTGMAVVEATDGLQVLPDCVHVIPPNKDLSLLHGRLHLLDPVSPRGQRLPIDFFLRTLADDCKADAVGVILSGMGSDGVFGLRAIKEGGGLTLVQDPIGAVAESMPRSAIEAGVVDIVASAEALPGRIADYFEHPARLSSPGLAAPLEIVNALDRIIVLLRDRTHNDFSLYKTNTLCRRIERRMAVHRLATVDDYVGYLRANAPELDLLFKELLIGVTGFFRDAEIWETLRSETLPALFALYPGGRQLRAWVPACSTGEEAYSLAIVFREALALAQPEGGFSLQIYATDLDPDAIDAARKGFYPDNIAADISAARLERHFSPATGGGYTIARDIRDMVVFAPQNIISDPPFTKLDILTCRNLLIYFDAELQKRLMPVFHYALNRNGVLVLGSAETVGSFGQLFAPANAKSRIFRRLDQTRTVPDLKSPGRAPATPAVEPLRVERADSIARLTDEIIQQTWAPPAVLVNGEGDILYVSGRTGRYLEPAAGKTNMNIHAMAREGLREALTGVIRKAQKDLLAIRLNGLKVGTNGGTQIVDVVVQGIDKPDLLRGHVLVLFREVPVTAPARRRRTGGAVAPDVHGALLQELQQTREALHVTHEEMQTTVEELKSTNEELQSTNEELQSANEELTTSKEELQSINEELQTVNGELQSKVDDLTWVQNDMANLLNSTEIATVFLDNQMKVRRFTTHATRLFKLIPGDVGRALSDVVTDLDYPHLKDDALEVLRTLVFQEKVVAARDGRWSRVRIMPYRTQDNVIDGVVITFIDITEIKQLEAALRKQGTSG